MSELWDEKETCLLQLNYEASPKEKMLLLLPDRSWSAIVQRASKLGDFI